MTFSTLITLTFLLFTWGNPLFAYEGLDLITGKKVQFETKGKASVVFFLSTSCPCSNSHLEHLKDLKKSFSDFQFIGVHSNLGEKLHEAKGFYKKLKINFPVVYDKDLTIANSFKASKTPHVFVFSKEGERLYHGGVTNSQNFKYSKRYYLKSALENISKGQKVEKPFTRILGCRIARKV